MMQKVAAAGYNMSDFSVCIHQAVDLLIRTGGVKAEYVDPSRRRSSSCSTISEVQEPPKATQPAIPTASRPAPLPEGLPADLTSQFRGPGAAAFLELVQGSTDARKVEPELEPELKQERLSAIQRVVAGLDVEGPRSSAAEVAAPTRSPQPRLVLSEGTRVTLRGLSTASFNGLMGTCHKFVRETNRWEVVLDQGDRKSFKEENLKIVSGQAKQPPRTSQGRTPAYKEPSNMQKCQIQETAIGAGVAPCSGKGEQCPHCKKFYCPYHLPVNMDDGIFSFGGHACPACRPS